MPQMSDSQATDAECRCLVCLQEVFTVLLILKDMKSDSLREFRQIFEETSELGVNFHGEDFELRKPRLNQRQRHRSNVPATTAENYYRIILYNEICRMSLLSCKTCLQTIHPRVPSCCILFQASVPVLTARFLKTLPKL